MLGYGAAGKQPRVTKFPAWVTLPSAPDDSGRLRSLIVGVGQPELLEFRPADQEAAIEWLASDDAAWLDALRRAAPVDDPEGEFDEDILPMPGVAAASLSRLVSASGDLGMGAEVQTGGRVEFAIDVYEWGFRLYSLRASLKTALGLLDLELSGITAAAAAAAMEDRAPGITAELDAFYSDARRAQEALLRLFVLVGTEWLTAGRLVEPDTLGGAPSFSPGPVTPLQEIFFIIAMSIGALDPPHALPGVYQCGYHLCRKVFTSPKKGVVGTRRFCCPEHGRRFYASRRMKEKSKKARRAAPPEGE